MSVPQPLLDALKKSLAEKRGVTFFLAGGTVAGVVTKVDEHVVMARSQSHSEIVILLDHLLAVALS